MIKGTCENCGREFSYYPSRSGKFCSRKCFFEQHRGKNHPWYKGKVSVKCTGCGKELLVYPHRLMQRLHFCSIDCKANWQKEHLVGGSNPNFKGGDLKRICERCGSEFTIWRWKTDRKYCSTKCSAQVAAEKTRKRRVCENCSKQIFDRHNLRFCSKKCEGEYNRGENNPFYRGTFSETSLRRIIKARHSRPNRVESRLINLLEEYSLPFRFVGNGEVIIDGKNPDFIYTGNEKKIIELFGIYWHSPLYRRIRPTSTYEAVKSHYAENGYDCLIIWDVELATPKLVVQKINKFVGGMRNENIVAE